MKKPALALLLCIVSIHFGFSQSFDSTAERMVAHYRAIRGFHPRLEGSTGERSTLDYISETVTAVGLNVSQRGFDELENAHSFSTVGRVDVPGLMAGRVFVLVPLNHAATRNRREDGSVNLAAALTILEAATTDSNRPSLSVLFLGADVGERRLGSRLFLERLDSTDNRSAVYLDLHAPQDRVTVELGAEGLATPRWLSETVVRALTESGIPKRQVLSSLQASRSRLSAPSFLSEYLEARLPAVRVRSAAPNASPAENAQRAGMDAAWARGFLSLLENVLRRAAPPEQARWDRHYVYAIFGQTVLFLGERTYLLILLLILSSPIIYGLLLRRRLRRYARLVGRYAWALVVLLGLAFFFFFIATALLQGIMDFRNFPTLWQYAPGSYFILKIVLSVFLFAFVFQSLRNLPFPRSGSFYSASALFLLFLDVLLLSVFDVSFTFYFLWGFLFAFLFAISRWAGLKLFFMLAAPLWLVVALIELFVAGELTAARALLLSPVTGNLIFAFVLLPFLLMLIRVDFMMHQKLRLPHGGTLRLTVLASAAAAVLFSSALVFLEPFTAERPQPVEVFEVLDQTTGEHRIEVSSPAPLGELSVSRGGRWFTVDTESRSHTFEIASSPPTDTAEAVEILTVDASSQEFLSRSRRRLRLESTLPPRAVEVELYSPEELLIFDADFPVRFTGADQARVLFEIGRFPPNPLMLSYTVAQSLPTRTEVRLTSLETPQPIRTDKRTVRLYPATRVRYALEQ